MIVLVGAAAIVRSMNASLSTAGNYGFKRDLSNQAERAVEIAMGRLRGGGTLSTETARETSSVANNYSATILATNSQGIPLEMLPGGTFTSVASPANDISIPDMGVKISYVVDRLCSAAGALGSNSCIWASGGPPKGGGDRKLVGAADGADLSSPSSRTPLRSAIPRKAVYRLTVQVTGPRNTQAFYQSTFTD